MNGYINNNHHLKKIECGLIFKDNKNCATAFSTNCSKDHPYLKVIAETTPFSNSMPVPAEILEEVHPHTANTQDVEFIGD